MPRLTAANLVDLVRGARRHLYGTDDKPASLVDVAQRPRILGREVTAWVLGPKDGRYVSHFGVGIMELNRVAPGAGFSERQLFTIEQTFEKYLAQYPAPEGFDVVVILHSEPIATLFDVASLDGDAEVCTKKVWAAKR